MADIKKLYDSKIEAINKARNFLDTHADAAGLLTAEDSQTYDRMEADIQRIEDAIKRENTLNELNASLNKPATTPIVNTPDTGVVSKKVRPTATDSYKEAYDRYLRDRAVGYEVRNALEVGVDTEGGYLVPDEYDRNLIEALREENVMRRLAHVIRTASGDRKIPVVTEHGIASWIDEEGAYTESDEKFGQVTLSAHKIGTMMKISEELLADSMFNMPNYIATEFARRIGAGEEEAFISGNGAGRPTGILADNGGAPVGVTAAGATAITADELMDLFYSVKSPYRKKGAWLMNDACIKAIRKLKTQDGNYLWQPSLTADTPDRLLNKPLYTSAYMPALEAGNKVAVFGDFNYYWIADRGSRAIKRLNELYAANGQVGFLGMHRVDGKLILPEAVKVLQLKTGA